MCNFRLFFILSALFGAGCSGLDPSLKGLGSTILGSTGYVSGSQVDAAFEAGGKLGKAAESLTDEQEYYLGRSVSALVFAKYRPLKNTAAVGYVNRVGRAVAGFSDKPDTFAGYHFMILDSEEVNALSAPGGFVFITKGLVRLLPDEDALAGVLAHEVAHIVKGHGTSAISGSNLTSALLIIGKEAAASQGGATVQQLTGLFGDSVNEIFETVLTKGYSRSQEYAADAYAAELLSRSGYNPVALESALQQLKKADIAEDSGGWASTHPKPERRLSELKDLDLTPKNDHMQRVREARFRKALAGLVG